MTDPMTTEHTTTSRIISAYCRHCRSDGPASIRHNGGASFDLCCDNCHSVLTTFNQGNPFAALTEAVEAFVAGVEEGHIVARDPDFIEGRPYGHAVQLARAALAERKVGT